MNMPISMQQHMLIQGKFQQPVKQEVHQRQYFGPTTDTFQIFEEVSML